MINLRYDIFDFFRHYCPIPYQKGISLSLSYSCQTQISSQHCIKVILTHSINIPFFVILVRSVSEDTRIQYIDVIVYGSSGLAPLTQG